MPRIRNGVGVVDKYRSYEKLKQNEQKGEDFRIVFTPRNSGVAVIAPHGGRIESGTSQIAQAVAGTKHTLYIFEGLKRTGNIDLHITSANFDEPTAIKAVKDARFALAIHGCKGTRKVVYIGGKDDKLISIIEDALNAQDFIVKRHQNPNLQGVHARNICNRNATQRGVQLELTKGLRCAMLIKCDGKTRRTSMFTKFVQALQQALKEALTESDGPKGPLGMIVGVPKDTEGNDDGTS
jgi:phage replication-related protein YjqB (UPF0714/DUF867 family)